MLIEQQRRWSDEAEQGLGRTLQDDGLLLKTLVNQQQAQLWRIDSSNGRSWMITRIEPVINSKPELVVCCYCGCDLPVVVERIISSAQQQGIGSIRYHTQRKGLNRLLRLFGFTERERVYNRSI